MAFQVIGTLSLIGGLLLSLALFDKEYALGLLGISAIVNAVIMFGFAAVIRNLAGNKLALQERSRAARSPPIPSA